MPKKTIVLLPETEKILEQMGLHGYCRGIDSQSK